MHFHESSVCSEQCASGELQCKFNLISSIEHLSFEFQAKPKNLFFRLIFFQDEFGRPGIGSDPVLSAQMALVNSRVNSLGRQQYQPNMTSGYTGFVPRFQTILGHTYSPACNRALARFEQDQWRDRLFTKELEALDGWRFCYKRKPWETNEVMRPANQDLQEFRRAPPASPTAGCGCAGRS